MEKLILEIIEEIILEKKRKSILPDHCSKMDLMNELAARRDLILEKLIDNGILHEGPLATGVYFEFN